MQFPDNVGPDQIVYSRSLIRSFVACLQHQWILLTNIECPDQTAQMCTPIWTFAVPIWHKGLFPMLYIICSEDPIPSFLL